MNEEKYNRHARRAFAAVNRKRIKQEFHRIKKKVERGEQATEEEKNFLRQLGAISQQKNGEV